MKYSAFFDPPSSDDGEEDMEVDNEDVNASKKKKSVNFNEDKNTEHSTFVYLLVMFSFIMIVY